MSKISRTSLHEYWHFVFLSAELFQLVFNLYWNMGKYKITGWFVREHPESKYFQNHLIFDQHCTIRSVIKMTIKVSFNTAHTSIKNIIRTTKWPKTTPISYISISSAITAQFCNSSNVLKTWFSYFQASMGHGTFSRARQGTYALINLYWPTHPLRPSMRLILPTNRPSERTYFI